MAIKKINELPDGNINKLIGLDENGNIKLAPVNTLPVSTGKYILVENMVELEYDSDLMQLQLNHADFKTLLDTYGHGILHIFSANCYITDAYYHNKIILNNLTMVENEEGIISICDRKVDHVDYTAAMVICQFESPLFSTQSTDEENITIKTTFLTHEVMPFCLLFEPIEGIDDVINKAYKTYTESDSDSGSPQ